MLVWRQWCKTRTIFGEKRVIKIYKMLLLFGFIPLYIFIDGSE